MASVLVFWGQGDFLKDKFLKQAFLFVTKNIMGKQSLGALEFGLIHNLFAVAGVFLMSWPK